MCNFLHKNSEPISEKGTGWKYFYRQQNGQLTAWYGMVEYRTNESGKAIFDSAYYKGDGFCFFTKRPRYAEAIDVSFTDAVLIRVKINYEGGLGQHRDRSVNGDPTMQIALCKSFSLHTSVLRQGMFL